MNEDVQLFLHAEEKNSVEILSHLHIETGSIGDTQSTVNSL